MQRCSCPLHVKVTPDVSLQPSHVSNSCLSNSCLSNSCLLKFCLRLHPDTCYLDVCVCHKLDANIEMKRDHDVVQDGGYHVPFAHKGLASGLQLDSYTSSLYERLSIQSCAPQQSSATADQRLGKLLLHHPHALELITQARMPETGISIQEASMTGVSRTGLACRVVEHECCTISMALLSRGRAKTVWLRFTADPVGLFVSACPDADISSNLTAVQNSCPFRAEPQNLGQPKHLIHSSILPQLSLHTTASEQHLHLLFLRTSSASRFCIPLPPQLQCRQDAAHPSLHLSSNRIVDGLIYYLEPFSRARYIAMLQVSSQQLMPLCTPISCSTAMGPGWTST